MHGGNKFCYNAVISAQGQYRITGHNTQPCFHNSLMSEAQENGDQAKIRNTFLVPPQGSFL